MTAIAAYFDQGMVLALDLANSASGYRRGTKAGSGASVKGQIGLRITDPATRARVAVKLRAVLDTRDPHDAGPLVNELLHTYRARPELIRDGEGAWRLHLHPSTADVEALDAVKATSGLAVLIDEQRWQNLKQCGASACDDYFLDESPNNTRRYCSRTCANRNAARAHRDRRRRDGSVDLQRREQEALGDR